MSTRFDNLHVVLHPEVRSDANLGWAFDLIEDRSREGGAEVFRTGARDHDGQLLDLLARRGYRVDRHGRRWELDLVANRERLLAMAEDARRRMAAQGVRLLTLAEDDHPERYRQLHELDEEAGQDVPTTVPYVGHSFDAFMKWFDDPALHPDRLWIAREGDLIVGLSVLSYPPVRGHVFTDWTATLRSVRGRGIARSLKLETLVQALRLGVRRVRTENDSENAPILHLNEQLGYHDITGLVGLLKPAASKP
jgi:GNAT superfamily N-acetyltransferase